MELNKKMKEGVLKVREEAEKKGEESKKGGPVIS